MSLTYLVAFLSLSQLVSCSLSRIHLNTQRIATCKAIPTSPEWPSEDVWRSLNSSVGGALIKTVAPGSVCHQDQPNYDAQACPEIQRQWSNSSFHSSNYISVDYNDDTCPPDQTLPCSLDGYARYVVNASTADHVKQAVNFARAHNVRLNIKGTGHDWNVRSSSPNSLSIWTHHLRELSVYNDFVPQGCEDCQPQPAVKIGAGQQWRDVYLEMSKHNILVVGGSNPTVGIGGYLMAGGHSPISSAFGLSSDQALEFELVTADGSLLNVNEAYHPDLVWAMRGGGASTFGVMTSVTVRSFPERQAVSTTLTLSAPPNSDTLWNSFAYLHSQIPYLSENGLMGYYWGFPTSFHDPTGALSGGSFPAGFLAAFHALNTTVEAINSLCAPMKTYFDSQPYADKINFTITTTSVPTVYDILKASKPENVGTRGWLGSRLLDGPSLSNISAVASAMKQASGGQIPVLGHMVAGPGPRNAEVAGGSSGVLPAWRKAYTHVVLPASWNAGDEQGKARAENQLTNVRVAALRDLAPNSGAYVNEGDHNEPDWQHAFWGDNYSRLLEIKNQWDPQGIFYAYPGVGAEQWTLSQAGQLCRV